MLKILKNLLLLLLLTGCAATYKLPEIKQQDFTRTVNAPKIAILDAAKRTLVLDGYQIISSDDQAGIISTARRQLSLTENDCDCGTTMGLPYIKDKRTVTNVSVGMVISDEKVIIQSTIEGEYLKGNAGFGAVLNCISKGVIEEKLFNSIKDNIY